MSQFEMLTDNVIDTVQKHSRKVWLALALLVVIGIINTPYMMLWTLWHAATAESEPACNTPICRLVNGTATDEDHANLAKLQASVERLRNLPTFAEYVESARREQAAAAER